MRFAEDPGGFFAAGRLGVDGRVVDGSATDSAASDEAAAVCRRFVEGVDERGEVEDDVDRAAVADRPVVFFAAFFGVEGDVRAAAARAAAFG